MNIVIRRDKETILECEDFHGDVIQSFFVKRHVLQIGDEILMDGCLYTVVRDRRYGKKGPVSRVHWAKPRPGEVGTPVEIEPLGKKGDFIGEKHGVYPIAITANLDEFQGKLSEEVSEKPVAKSGKK